MTATFEFRHELYRQALYESIPASRRARLHLALGDCLETAWGDRANELAGEIADHFTRAHEAARALKYFYPAALKSFNRSANREAVTTLNHALGQIATLPSSCETMHAARELHLLRASAMITLEGWASLGVEESYRQAQKLGKELQIEDCSAEQFGIAAMHELRGLYSKSQSVLEALMADTPSLGLEAHELLACSLFHQGKFNRSKDSADQAVDQYDPAEVSHILARYGENPGVGCHGWASLDLWFMGFPDASLQRSDDALRLAEEHIYSMTSALTYRTFLHQFRNEPQETLDWASKTIEVAVRQGFDFRVAQASLLGGWAKATLADNTDSKEDALGQMQNALADHQAMGAEMDVPHYQVLFADVFRQLGKTGPVQHFSLASRQNLPAAFGPGLRISGVVMLLNHLSRDLIKSPVAQGYLPGLDLRAPPQSDQRVKAQREILRVGNHVRIGADQIGRSRLNRRADFDAGCCAHCRKYLGRQV